MPQLRRNQKVQRVIQDTRRAGNKEMGEYNGGAQQQQVLPFFPRGGYWGKPPWRTHKILTSSSVPLSFFRVYSEKPRRWVQYTLYSSRVWYPLTVLSLQHNFFFFVQTVQALWTDVQYWKRLDVMYRERWKRKTGFFQRPELLVTFMKLWKGSVKVSRYTWMLSNCGLCGR